MNKIRVKTSGRFKAKTNGGQYWEVTVNGEADPLGEIEGKTKRLFITVNPILSVTDLNDLLWLVGQCHTEYLNLK